MLYCEGLEQTAAGSELLMFKYKTLKLEENRRGNAVYHTYQQERMRFGTRSLQK